MTNSGNEPLESKSFQTQDQGEAAALHSLGSDESARHLLAGGAVAPADATLVEFLVGADGAVTAGLHTLALHAHGRGVGAARGAIHHLGDTRVWLQHAQCSETA